ncbi:MAG: cytochrome c oxidase cbb3-type subunit 1, partial [Flavobacteriales bacterium]
RPKMYSLYLINLHFWLATVGVVLYIVAMWMSGVLQGLMWRAINADGTLTYSFVESLEASKPFYLLRFVGGVLVVTGMLIMAYNVYKTIRTETESESEEKAIETKAQPA